MKLLNMILLLTLIGISSLYAQVKTITGRVTDYQQKTLPGITIIETKNPKNTTVTDINGSFKITITDASSKLKFSGVGLVTITLPINDTSPMLVNMKSDVKGLEEVIVVGYSTQKRITNTGAVSSIKAADVRDIPTSSIQNTLAGRLPGFFSTQRSGQPGSDAADFNIRGLNSLNGDNQPLILVDDITYTYAQVAQLDVNEIETITILKDASTTAIYGVKGANGVLLITTKRGSIGKPKINLTAESGVDVVIKLPIYEDAYTTALLMNQAFTNDSYGLSSPLTLPWTATDLQKFKDGSDPYGHPNVNWQKELLNSYSSQKKYNVDVSGGNNTVKYFTSLGYFSQDGILKHFAPTKPEDDVDNNYFYNRVNFRSNIDIAATKTLKLRFDINGRFETVNNPGGVLDGGGLFKELSAFGALSPLTMPLRNPNGSYGYGSQFFSKGYANPIARMANGGYKRNFNNNFNVVIGADQKLDFIAQGLVANLLVSYAGNINEYRNVTRDVTQLPVYFYNSADDSYTIKNANYYKLPPYSQGTGNSAFNNNTSIIGSLKYDRTFGNNHIYALALINQQSYVNGSSVPVNFRGLSARAGYDYKQKYLVELNLGYNGNDLFLKKYGTFPSISAGWNIAGEDFVKKNLPFFDLLKIRGSIGLTGSDYGTPGTIPTSIIYNTSGGGPFGNGASEGSLINSGITWAKERQTDIGLDINMWNGKVSVTADVYDKYRYDQLISQGDVPLLIGQSLPYRNIGISDNKGFDWIVTYKDHVGKLNYSLSLNASYTKNKAVYVSEAPDYPYQAQTGRPLNLTMGYHNIGFYQQSDFDANGQVKAGVPKPLWSTIQPGDLKYADLNGDGVITTADQTFLSKPNVPPATYGFNLGLNYKGFSLNALLQGAFGYAVEINAEGADAFNGNIQPFHLNAWTPATAATATYPRIGFNTNINGITWLTRSDFTMTDANYLRLKSVVLGYQIPNKLMEKISVRSARIYLSGYNLLTWRSMGKYNLDPEIASGQGNAYPVTANFNLGVQVGF